MAAQGEGGLAVFDRRDPESGQPCNAHSWSDGGEWSPVCYTADGRYAQAIWSKPREITNGAYPAMGFEIGAWDNFGITPEKALQYWQESPSHDAVIRESGAWKGSNFKAMGVAVQGSFAYVWFGKVADAVTE